MRIKGIALVQVLLFTAIFSVILLYFSQVTHQQVKIAVDVKDRVQAEINLHSESQKLFFEMLTEAKEFLPDYEKTARNYFGSPFDLSTNVSVQLYDISSRLNLRYPSNDLLLKLLVAQGMQAEQAANWVSDLLDYQDVDRLGRRSYNEHVLGSNGIRNGPISDVSELRNLNLPHSVESVLERNTNLYSPGTFNPLNGSAELLTALYGDATAEVVMKLREEGRVSKLDFLQQTKIRENDDVFAFTGNQLQVLMKSSVGNITVTMDKEIMFNPYASAFKSPIMILVDNK